MLPQMMPPTGRMIKEIANTAKVASRAAEGANSSFGRQLGPARNRNWPMGMALRGHLRKVGDVEHLPPCAQVAQLAADDAGDVAADVGVDLVEDHDLDRVQAKHGDLKVTLSKGATSKVVFDSTGGSADDLKQTFTVTGITGSLAGDWTLKVEDGAAQDVGTLNSWTLEVTAE